MNRFLQSIRLTQNGRVRLMAFITIADTGLISYVSTRHLAERWGFGTLSWLYPLCLDAVAAVGMDLWMSRSPARRPAARLALSAVALSLAANVCDWGYVGPGAAVLGAVPPLMLAALLHTMHVHSTATTDDVNGNDGNNNGADNGGANTVDSTGGVARDSDTAPTTPAPDPVPELVLPTRTSSGPAPERPDDELIALIRTRESDGQQMSKRLLMSEFQIGNDRALRLLQTARNGHRPGLATSASST